MSEYAYCTNIHCDDWNEPIPARTYTEYGYSYISPEECPKCAGLLILEEICTDSLLDEILGVLDEAYISVEHEPARETNESRAHRICRIVEALEK